MLIFIYSKDNTMNSFHPSIHFLNQLCTSGLRGAGDDLSCHSVRGRYTLDSWLAYHYHREITNHFHSHSHP